MNINLFDFINAKEIAAFVTEKPENKIPYFGETLFPAQKQLGTDISWLKGANGLPVAIQPSNYDAKARMREKEGFDRVATEMAFFREAMRIGEKDRQQINLLLNNPQSQLALPLIRNIFNETARLVEGVRARAEIMRMQLLTSGKIDVTSADGRAKYIYDYGQANSFKPRQGTAGWGNDTADPVKDIIAWCDYMETKTVFLRCFWVSWHFINESYFFYWKTSFCIFSCFYLKFRCVISVANFHIWEFSIAFIKSNFYIIYYGVS